MNNCKPKERTRKVLILDYRLEIIVTKYTPITYYSQAKWASHLLQKYKIKFLGVLEHLKNSKTRCFKNIFQQQYQTTCITDMNWNYTVKLIQGLDLGLLTLDFSIMQFQTLGYFLSCSDFFVIHMARQKFICFSDLFLKILVWS